MVEQLIWIIVKGFTLGFLLSFMAVTMVTISAVNLINANTRQCHHSFAGYLVGQMIWFVVATSLLYFFPGFLKVFFESAPFKMIGGFFLIYLGFYLLRNNHTCSTSSHLLTPSFCQGISISLIVPQRLLTYLALFSLFHLFTAINMPGTVLILFMAVLTGLCCWWALFVYLVGQYQSNYTINPTSVYQSGGVILQILGLYHLLSSMVQHYFA